MWSRVSSLWLRTRWLLMGVNERPHSAETLECCQRLNCILQKQTLSELSVQGYVALFGNRVFMMSSRWRSSWIRRCPIHIDISVSESKERHREADTPCEGRRPGYELQAKDANSCQQTAKQTERPDTAIALELLGEPGVTNTYCETLSLQKYKL